MRVRFGLRSESEQRAFERFEQGLEKLFAAALAQKRESAWWSAQIRGLSPELDAEIWGSEVVVRSRERAGVPLADLVASRAPAALRVVSGRPQLPFERAVRALGARAKSFASAGARAGFTRGHLLEVVVNLPGGRADDEEVAAAEALVWGVLGERKADAWVGAVKVAPAPRGGALRVVTQAKSSEGFALGELAGAVDAAVAGLYAGLPDRPHWARSDSSEWTMFELEPEPSSDWADEDDLVMATTCVPELLKCRLSKQPFSSLRFSRHAESFFHLKYRSAGDPEERLASRQALEDALDRVLVAERAGRVLGAGLGLRYSYVLLALALPERSLARVVEAAQGARLPRESWLLPLDTDLSAEWCGVWPNSHAPFGLREERSR